MNYSFIDKYKSSDFIPSNSTNLYNEYNPSNYNQYKPTNYYWSDYSQDKNNWATENSIQKS
jgi:hypothetical protein